MLGLNVKVKFYNNTSVSDDDAGGAVLVENLAYSNIRARLSARRPSQQALEQGLEVNRLFDMIIVGQSLVINERDEVEVTFPSDSPYYGERFRIMGIQHDSRRAGIGHTELTLSRIERARAVQ